VLTCGPILPRTHGEYSDMRTMDVWYDSIDLEELLLTVKDEEAASVPRSAWRKPANAACWNMSFPNWFTPTGLAPTIKEIRPLHLSLARTGVTKEMSANLQRASPSIGDHPGRPASSSGSFQSHGLRTQVVGVGSVGTLCRHPAPMANERDPFSYRLNRQALRSSKPMQARAPTPIHGQRVVNGCRLMQSASDLFLGWTEGDSVRAVSTSGSSRT